MNFNEAFEGLVINGEFKNFSNSISVEQVIISKQTGKITVVISRTEPMEKRHLLFIKKILSNQVFTSREENVVIEEKYDLSKYSLEDIFPKTRDRLLEEISEKGKLYHNIISSSKVEVADDTINIENEDNFIVREKLDEITAWLKGVFEKRYNKQIKVKTNFVEPKKKPETYTIDIADYNFPAEKNSNNKDESTIYDNSVDFEPANTNKKEEGKNLPVDSNKTLQKETKKSKYYRKQPKDPAIFYGRSFEGSPVNISYIQDEYDVVIRGQITKKEQKETKTGKTLITFNITDFTDSITCKIFVDTELLNEDEEFKNKLNESLALGKFVQLKGKSQNDKYEHELTIGYVYGIKNIEDFIEKRIDSFEKKRVELNLHTIMSEMNAVIKADSLLKTLNKWGHSAVAITDDAVVQSFTDVWHAKQKLKMDDFKIIYGMEGYMADDVSNTVRMGKGQKLTDNAVVFDIETTGFGPKNCRIIEIGAVKVANGEIIDRFSTLINPGTYIPEEITNLTSITNEMVRNELDITVILPKFLDFCKGCFLVAHNSSFDTSFIMENMRKQGFSQEFTIADTVTMARILLPGLKNYKLDTVAEKLKVSLEHHHRAVDDTECTAKIYIELCKLAQKKYGNDLLENFNRNKGFDADTIRKMATFPLTILAKNDTGRVNLYKIVSLSHLKYFQRRPRIPKSIIIENREGLLLGSGTYEGELYQAILRGHGNDEIEEIVKFYDYLEIQPISNYRFMVDDDKISDITCDKDLIEINRKIVELGEIYGKPVVATSDAHFLNPEDEIYRRIILNVKEQKKAERKEPLYLRTTEEMLSEFSYLGEKAEKVVIDNTNLIADMIEDIAPVRPDKCPPVIENSDVELKKICYDKAHELYGEELPQPVIKRLEHELNSIIKNGFAVMYIIAQKLVWKSNEDGYLVGSRGSVGSSFVAFLSGITEVNSLPAHYRCNNCHFTDFDSEEVKNFSGRSGCDMPDKTCPKCGEPLIKEGHDIPFETFLGFNGDKEPDIDLNFSGEYQAKAHAYTEVIFGKGQTFKAGTIGGVADKTAYGYVLKYNEEHNIMMKKPEMERISTGCIGVRRTTGQHPGGIVVLPIGENIYSFTPIQHPANDMNSPIITTHFDYHSIDHNLLKLDILGHDDPTMIRMLEDITGIDAKNIRLDDEKVLSLFSNTDALNIKSDDFEYDLGSLGVPEFGTDFVMQMLRDTRPRSFSELVRISGLSHGTDVWTGNAQTLIADGKCTLQTAICTRDDIMNYLISMGIEPGISFKIMESVRKGKGLSEEWEKLMTENGVPDWYIWSCKKIAYMFPKAHAVAYVMMGFRIAYYKVYYPLAYYAAYFSIRATAFDYGMFCFGKEKLQGIVKNIKNTEKKFRKAKDKEILSDACIVLEMYARGFEFLPIDIYKAEPKRFQIIDGKIMPSLSTIGGLGDKAAYSLYDATKKGKFVSKNDLKQRAKGITQTAIDNMAEMGLLEGLPETSQISLFDLV